MFAAADTVRVDEPAPVIEVGLKVPVAPRGNPVTLSETAELKPPITPPVVVYVVLPPCTADCDPGVDDIVKSGGTFTINVTIVECTRLPLVPVIVTV